jgi:hypothetical protein
MGQPAATMRLATLRGLRTVTPGRRALGIGGGLLACLAVGLALATSGFGLFHVDRPAPPVPPSGPTRPVGANGLVLSVPAGWDTRVEQGSECPPIEPNVVEFYLPVRDGLGSCSSRPGASVPPENTLAVFTDPPNVLPRPDTDSAGTVAGMPFYISDAVQHSGPGVARRLLVPAAGVTFTVGAATTAEADGILATLRTAPADTTTIAITRTSDIEPPFLDNPPSFHLHTHTVQAMASGQLPVGFPGEFLGTRPPVGTPVPPGTMVTLVFATGDLDAFVSRSSLSSGGWHVSPARQLAVPVTRSQALRAVPHAYPSGQIGPSDGTFLRHLNGRLVWIVTLPHGHMIRLAAVDARAGRVVADHRFLMLRS